MSALNKALEVLKQRLQEISENRLARVTSSLETDEKNPLAANLAYDHPDFLSRKVKSELQLHSSSKIRYSQGVLQAIYNMADLASSGIGTLVLNGLTVRENFRFLDRETWVPKIINEKTQRVGLALQEFLHKVLTDPIIKTEVLNTIPDSILFVNIDKEASFQQLQVMKNQLDARLAIYAIHTPEKISEAKEVLKFKNGKKSEWNQYVGKLYKKIDKLKDGLKDNSDVVKTDLTGHTDAVHAAIKTAEEQRELLITLLNSFEQFSNSWKKEIDEKELPLTVNNSIFIQSLINNEIEIGDCKNLYEVHKMDFFWSEHPRETLDQYYNIAPIHKKDIEDVIGAFDARLKNLKDRLEAEEALPIIKQQLEQQKQRIKTVPLPPSLTQTETGLNYIIELSKDEDLSARFEANKQAYNTLLEDIKRYEAQLLEQDQLFDIFPKCLQRYAQTILQEAEIDVDERHSDFLQKTAELNTLTKKIQRELLILDKESRQKELNRLHSHVSNKFKISQEAKHQLTKADFDNSKFLGETHPARLAEIEKTYQEPHKKISDQMGALEKKLKALGGKTDNSSVRQLSEAYNARKPFFEQANTQLNQFSRIIKNSNDIYFPVNQIDKNDLIKYLEAGNNKEEEDFINSLYEKAQTASAWRGLNLSNVFNKAKHYTTFMAPSEFDEDLNTIIKMIDNKRESIAAQRTAASVQTLREELAKHTRIRDQQLELLDNDKSSLEKKVNQATETNELATKGHRQAMITANLYALDCKLADFNNMNEVLSGQIKNNSIDPELVSKLTRWAETKQDHRDLSPHDLKNQIIWDSAANKTFAPLASYKELEHAINFNLAIIKITTLQNEVKAFKDELDEVEDTFELSVEKQEELLTKMNLLHDKLKEFIRIFPNDILKDKTIEPKLIETLAIHESLTTNLNLVKTVTLRNELKAFKEELDKDIYASIERQEELLEKMNQLASKSSYFDELPVTSQDDKHIQSVAKEIDTYFAEMDTARANLSQAIALTKLLNSVKEKSVAIANEIDEKGNLQHLSITELEQLYLKTSAILQKLTELNESSHGQNPAIMHDPHLQIIRTDLKNLMEKFENTLPLIMEANDKAIEKHNKASTRRSLQDEVSRNVDKFFGTGNRIGGVFGDYLTERSNTFWKRDFLENLAVLKFFSYESDATRRARYIGELKELYKAYNENPETGKDDLITKIDEGIEQFSPRAANSELSLQSTLANFKSDLGLDLAEAEEIQAGLLSHSG